MTCPWCAGAAAPRYAFDAYTVWGCRSCGSGFRMPPADPAAEAARYAEGYFQAWSPGDPGADDALRRMKRATFAGLLGRVATPRPGDRLLDVGCATGFLLEEARDRGWAPFGIEVSGWAAGRARETFGAPAIHVGGLGDCPFPAGTFGVVTLVDVLEHLPDPAGALARVAGLLAPGGTALIVTPSFPALSRRLLGRFWPHFKEEHLWYFSRAVLDRLAAAGGLARTGGGRMRKVMTVDYLTRHVERYAPAGLRGAAWLARALCPPGWRTRSWPAGLGESWTAYRKAAA